MRVPAALALAALLSTGCSSVMGMTYTPERVYSKTMADYHNVDTRLVRRVDERRHGLHWFFFQLKGFSARDIVDAHLDGSPDYYVSDLNMNVDMHASLFIAIMLGVWIPRLSVEFDLMEVKGWADPLRGDAPLFEDALPPPPEGASSPRPEGGSLR